MLPLYNIKINKRTQIPCLCQEVMCISSLSSSHAFFELFALVVLIALYELFHLFFVVTL